ncbi:MAG: lipase family alpha/beta hydrolase [Candidatus Merdisoma sp.]|jgi:triacylglycerol lipase
MSRFLKKLYLAIVIPCALNLPVTLFLLTGIMIGDKFDYDFLELIVWLAAVFFLCAGTYLWILAGPVHDGGKTGLRVRMMMGGRRSVFWGLYGMAAQIFIACIFSWTESGILRAFGGGFWISDMLLAVTGILSLLGVGALRIFFTSRRLSIVRRIVMLLTWWIPVVNLAVLLYVCRLVYEEYDFEREKAELRALRVDSDLCATRYPLLLVHGIGFRDLRYFNYWGRIPRELKRNGAVVYYGNQEALGTIAYNAEDIRKRILQIREETGAEKVNIIAHSKGGLDARCAVSTLGMSPFVASLTTMNTPHRGCRFVDYACRLPESFYRFVAGCFDRTFARFGDKAPDFYTATRQFSTEASARFNEKTPDMPGVYYQSYTSKMKNPFSHLLLSIPYCMIRPLEGENDGLVSVESAKWGEFRGVFSNKRLRGISHGDIIDLKRQDYKGFDVVETYVQIVAELKERGF